MSFVVCVSSIQSPRHATATVAVNAGRARGVRASVHSRPQRGDAFRHQKLALVTRHRTDRSAVALRAAEEEDDAAPPTTADPGEAPAAAPTAEDDEEVKGAQKTAIVTGE